MGPIILILLTRSGNQWIRETYDSKSQATRIWTTGPTRKLKLSDKKKE